MLRVIVPALNEARNLPALFERLGHATRDLDVETGVILVDDGSTDDTADVAGAAGAALGVRVLRHATNLGPGAAFRTGFLAARELHRAGDLWCTMESDNTSDLGVLGEMLRRAAGGADVVLASPQSPGGSVKGVSPARHLLSVAGNGALRVLAGLPRVHTFTSFYRVYRGDFMVRALDAWGERLIEEPGFVHAAELLLKLRRLGARIEEVPMSLDARRRVGRSTMRVGRNLWASLRLAGRYLASAGFRTGGRPRG